MKRSLLHTVLCFVALFALGNSQVFAQAQAKSKDQSSKATEKAAEKAPAKKAEAPAAKAADEYRRVPQYFGQIDLTDAQREQIYSIREKHASKLEQLEGQLTTLRETMMRESESVLTASQKTALNKLRAEAKAKSAAKAKAKAKN